MTDVVVNLSTKATAAAPSLEIAEVFGPTVQGEGPSTGRLASFIRLGRCNLHCSWCDTSFTWDWEGLNGVAYDPADQITEMTIEEILTHPAVADARLLVITGGEPLLQQNRRRRAPAWYGLLEGLAGKRIEIETNGTVAPTEQTVEHVTQFNVSPKLANNGADSEERRLKPEVLKAFSETGKAEFKFVAQTPDDVDEAARIVDQIGIDPGHVWIMPEGADEATMVRHARELVDYVTNKHGFNFTGRLHVTLWRGERGH